MKKKKLPYHQLTLIMKVQLKVLMYQLQQYQLNILISKKVQDEHLIIYLLEELKILVIHVLSFLFLKEDSNVILIQQEIP